MTGQSVTCLNDLICQDFRCFQFATSEESGRFVFHKHDQLKSGVEKWTKIFQGLSLRKNPKIGIIHELNFEYICILFAAIQVGANFVILDSRFDNLLINHLYHWTFWYMTTA